LLLSDHLKLTRFLYIVSVIRFTGSNQHTSTKMKAAFFLAAAGFVAAQDLSGQPQCAVSQTISTLDVYSMGID
jgi:hypothetical protein